MVSRRDFIKGTSAAALAAGAFPRLLASAADEMDLGIRGKDGMIVRSARFLDLEMPAEFATSWITPLPHFFVRNHMHEPSTLVPSEWRLEIAGEVDNPFTMSLGDLGKLQQRKVVNTIECAGNGRGFQQPHVPGVQWERGAVGTARFSGPSLRDILNQAGLKNSAKHVMFRGLDEAPGKVPPFIRSIPVEKAMDPDTLIATRMNDAPLTQDHGFPARSLVPGWVGAASVKWLGEIRVLNKEFEGNFMRPGYRLPNLPVKPGETVNPENTHPLTALALKSIIATPGDGANLTSRKVRIIGAAWAGEQTISRVEVSTDGGGNWHPANLAKDQSKYAWRLWSYEWKAPKPGQYTLMSRATDNRGNMQPEKAVWNPSGYLYNAIDRVRIQLQG